MFDFNEELKYYEPGLEVLEDSLSGQEEKDLVTLLQTVLTAKGAGTEEPKEEKRE